MFTINTPPTKPPFAIGYNGTLVSTPEDFDVIGLDGEGNPYMSSIEESGYPQIGFDGDNNAFLNSANGQSGFGFDSSGNPAVLAGGNTQLFGVDGDVNPIIYNNGGIGHPILSVVSGNPVLTGSDGVAFDFDVNGLPRLSNNGTVMQSFCNPSDDDATYVPVFAGVLATNADPHVAGALYNAAGIVKISAG